MKFTMQLQVPPGDVKNLATISDPRKASKHEIYGSLQIAFNGDAMHWVTCRDQRHLAILTFPMDVNLPAPIELTIHEGTRFLKALDKEPFEITMTEDLVTLKVGDIVDTFICSPTPGRLSFRRLRNTIHDRWEAAKPATWSTIAFGGADAKLFGSFVTAEGKPTTVTLSCEGNEVPSSFRIVGSAVHGMACMNHTHTTWNPEGPES